MLTGLTVPFKDVRQPSNPLGPLPQAAEALTVDLLRTFAQLSPW